MATEAFFIIDYLLIDRSLVRKVIALKVLDQPWFSDHCPLALNLSCDFKLKNKIDTDNDITPMKNFLWTSVGLCIATKVAIVAIRYVSRYVGHNTIHITIHYL